MSPEETEKLFKLALDARRWMESPSKGLALKMKHFLHADCACIAALLDVDIDSVMEEVERRYKVQTSRP
jgi:hypothetical protein